MYGRVVIYTYDEDKEALEAKARAAAVRSSPTLLGTSPTASSFKTTG